MPGEFDNLTVEQAERRLKEKHPGWDMIWYVPMALGGVTWCARRSPDDRKPLQATKAAHLDEYMTAVEAEEDAIAAQETTSTS